MAPVVLRTNVHCYFCARKIRNTIKNLLGMQYYVVRTTYTVN